MPRFGRKHPILAIGTMLGLAVCGVAGPQIFEGIAGQALAQDQQQQEEERRRRRNQQQDGGGQQQRQERRQDGGGQQQQQFQRQQGGDGGQERSRRQQEGGGQQQFQQRQQQGQGEDGGQDRRRRQQQGEDGGQERQRRQQQQTDDGQERSRRQQQQGEDGGQERLRRQQDGERERARQDEQRNQQLRQNADQERNDRERRRREAEEERAKQEQQRNQQLRQNADQERQNRERRRQEGDQERARQEEQRNQQLRQNADQDGQDRRRRQTGEQGGDQQDGDRDRRRLGRRDRPEDRERVEQDRQRFQRFERRELTGEERQERRRERREFTKENLQDVVRERRRRQEGGRTVIEEPDKRVIIREGDRAIIRHDETDRLRGISRNVREEREGGRRRTVITRENGVQIITLHDDDGRLIRRIKRFPDGHEIVLINNDFEGSRRRRDRYRDRDRDRDREAGFGFFIDLPDVEVDYGNRDYYAYYEDSGEDEIYEVLTAPPVQEFEEEYTLDEVRESRDIRQRLRKVNVNSVNFASGSWALSEDQIQRLSLLAKVINRVLSENPEEVFLISGHTDAVGSDEDNLSLSDRRAETVARILTDEFSVPAENLVTQGYGETDLLVQTSGDEVRNRRVEVMRITPALAREESGGTARQ
jgi:outer membrane protein OmpA-like peptidoglycan-associated protein